MADLTSSSPKPRPWQFSLRTLLLWMAFVALACSWYLNERAKIAAKHAAIRVVQKNHGSVVQGDPRRLWLPRLLGDDQPGDLQNVTLLQTKMVEPLAALQEVSQQSPLEVHINLIDSSTPALWNAMRSSKHQLHLSMNEFYDLKELARCRNLTGLELRFPCFDYDLAEIPQFRQLQELSIRGESISERGWRHLSDLPKLRRLSLSGCPPLTTQGYAALAKLPRLQTLELGPRFSAADIPPLAKFTGLKQVIVYVGDLSTTRQIRLPKECKFELHFVQFD